MATLQKQYHVKIIKIALKSEILHVFNHNFAYWRAIMEMNKNVLNFKTQQDIFTFIIIKNRVNQK